MVKVILEKVKDLLAKPKAGEKPASNAPTVNEPAKTNPTKTQIPADEKKSRPSPSRQSNQRLKQTPANPKKKENSTDAAGATKKPRGKASKSTGTQPKGERSANRQRRSQNKRRDAKRDSVDPMEAVQRRKKAHQPQEWVPSGKTAASSDPAVQADEAKTAGESDKNQKRRRPRNSRRDGNRADSRQQSNEEKPAASGGKSSQKKKSSRKSGGTGKAKGFSFPHSKPDHGEWDPASYQVEVEDGKTRFTDLNLPPELLHAVSDLGYKYCTPIQAGILPQLLDGEDGIGQAQTGTGKTAAFLMASLTRMLRNPVESQKNGTPRLLVVAPTRELVMQIEEEAAILAKYTPFQSLPVYGGLDYNQQREALQENVVDIVVATPGRLLDFLRNRVVNLKHVETLVLDEADRMLDMGFIPDVKRIIYATPHKDKRQTLFFSATFTDDVRRLADSWTTNPVQVEIAPENVAADTVDQTVYIVTEEQKFALVVNLLRRWEPKRCLIFANRRDSSQRLCDRLQDYDFKTSLLTGAVPQAKRVKVLEAFKTGELPILVATDVAGRGIHVDHVDLVINFNLPEDAEDFVHRIGRTGRAGSEGRSVCFACEFDSMLIPEIETYIGRELSCTQPEDAWLEVEDRPKKKRARSNSSSGGRGGARGGGGRSGRGGARGGGGRSGRGGPRGGGGQRSRSPRGSAGSGRGQRKSKASES